ncbi:MAG: hypothetical protein UY33_C0011G0016 [Candidatus Amesbacteria bacterium GW2011_GWA1_48_9]|uniref:Uncharacterized protein n=1 Tax=Candidatus Amesbacteria bacterium GW2011_GWA1_48_9 TaxID=1618355 RepID=A0A0G1XCW6_9BACT|nr:MAG: hypothetical protein UY33_C0011G0016 [Candidatus Amesbacteria bacterium GW2011_GWA1_48_9]
MTISAKTVIPAFLLIFLLVTAGFLYLNSKSQKQPPANVPSVPSADALLKEAQGEIIEEFPPLPVYPNSTLINTYKKAERGKFGYEGNWTTPDPVNTVMAWYLDSLPAAGWTIATTPENPDSDASQFMVLTKDRLLLNLTVENEDGNITEIIAEFPLSE